MTKLLMRTSSLIAAGVLINVVVALGIAGFSNRSSLDETIESTMSEERWDWWHEHFPFSGDSPNRSTCPVTVVNGGSVGFNWTMIHLGDFTAVEVIAGFPLKAMYGQRWVNVVLANAPTPPSESAALRIWSLPVPWNAGSDELASVGARMLPCAVAPVGFLVNTLIYASVIVAAVAAPRLILRQLRTRRGRCASCGYILRELETCPECGWQPGAFGGAA